MNKVVVTGLGFVTSIGNSTESVVDSLRQLRHGFAPFPSNPGERTPPKWIGWIRDYDVTGREPEDWIFPARFRLSKGQLKAMAPHALFAYCATRDALDEAGLEPDLISHPRTGLYSASAGSPRVSHRQIEIMNTRGVLRCSPFGVVRSTVGTINFNLGAIFGVRGASCGMASACASSAHALGFAHDEIALGRQDRMIVCGAEDGTREGVLAFSSMRALSTREDPKRASCPFDADRSGFVGTGGASTLILESEAAAKARGATILAEFAGWGQACDGHSPIISHPQGRGLADAMRNALAGAGFGPEAIDYVNAHATSTPVGDISEIRALKEVFGVAGGPAISSTKALSGHGLSLAGAMEAGFSVAAIRAGITPGSAHIERLDPECEGLDIPLLTRDRAPSCVLSNSSGFGGANVSLIFKKWTG